jgi:hypothetical protein
MSFETCNAVFSNWHRSLITVIFVLQKHKWLHSENTLSVLVDESHYIPSHALIATTGIAPRVMQEESDEYLGSLACKSGDYLSDQNMRIETK